MAGDEWTVVTFADPKGTHITFDCAGVVRFFVKDNQEYDSFDVANVIAIGEFTNEAGPIYDDWFMSIVTCAGMIYDVPCYIPQREELLAFLSEALGSNIDLLLFYSTDLKSRVIYPSILRDEPFFTYRQRKPKGFIEKISSLFGATWVESAYSPKVFDHMMLSMQRNEEN